MTTLLHMADAAFAANIPPGFPIAAGYIPGADDFHPWAPSDWADFPGYKLPITVPGVKGLGTQDAAAAMTYLQRLGVPEGSFMVLDMEGRVDIEYVTNFGAAMHTAYRVWVYGQQSTVFGNPPLNGYWVASYGISVTQMRNLIAAPHVRGVQYESGPGYDSSWVEQWTDGAMWQ